MDVIAILRAIWRHKLLTLPILVVTMLACVYAVKFRPPQYVTTVDYALVAPPQSAAPADVHHDPGLSQVSPNNPFGRFIDQSVVVDILTNALNNDPIHAKLIAAGATPSYSVTPSQKFGSPVPIAEVKGVGTTPGIANHTAALVSQEMQTELYKMQVAQGVNPYFMFTTIQLGHSGPSLQVSSKLRTMIGILGAGVIVLFIVISIADARSQSKRKREEQRADDEVGSALPDDRVVSLNVVPEMADTPFPDELRTSVFSSDSR
jgi:hypothetical protein